MMPEVDGFNVIDSIRADSAVQAVPIVVVTAKELTVRERDYLDAHADLLLQKGSSIDENFIDELVARLG